MRQSNPQDFVLDQVGQFKKDATAVFGYRGGADLRASVPNFLATVALGGLVGPLRDEVGGRIPTRVLDNRLGEFDLNPVRAQPRRERLEDFLSGEFDFSQPADLVDELLIIAPRNSSCVKHTVRGEDEPIEEMTKAL